MAEDIPVAIRVTLMFCNDTSWHHLKSKCFCFYENLSSCQLHLKMPEMLSNQNVKPLWQKIVLFGDKPYQEHSSSDGYHFLLLLFSCLFYPNVFWDVGHPQNLIHLQIKCLHYLAVIILILFDKMPLLSFDPGDQTKAVDI